MVKNCSILKQVVCAGNTFHFDYNNAAWLRKSKGICFLLIFGCSQLLNFNSATAQTVRNANNASIATIESDGTVRNSSNAMIGCIESDGDIRDRSNRSLGKLESDGTVRDRSNRSLGKIESDGTVRDQSNRSIGKVESDGTVRDSSNRTLGTAKGVPMRYAALYFFFDFFR